jgi:hypothetical protein
MYRNPETARWTVGRPWKLSYTILVYTWGGLTRETAVPARQRLLLSEETWLRESGARGFSLSSTVKGWTWTGSTRIK